MNSCSMEEQRQEKYLAKKNSMCLAQRIEMHNKILLTEVLSMMFLVELMGPITGPPNPSFSSFFFFGSGGMADLASKFGNDNDHELIILCSHTYL